MKHDLLGFLGCFSTCALMLAGCGNADTAVGSVNQFVHSDAPRETSPAPAADVQTLANDNAAFGMDLFRAAGPDANFIDSPYSISIALAMTYAGARTTTHDEMARVMHFTLGEPALHAAFDTVDLALDNRAAASAGKGQQAFKLQVANAIWGQKKAAVLPPFLDTLATYYGAGLGQVDFGGDTEGARRTINGWVSEKTETKIPELLKPGALTSDTNFVLTNAIYFLASWQSPFLADDTTDGAFHKLDASTATVPMMHSGDHAGSPRAYAEGDDWQALELRYAGDQVSMDVILPARDKFASFKAELDGTKLTSILSQLVSLPSGGVDVTLPRFSIRSPTGLKAALIALGMTEAFSGSADFSGIDGQKHLCLGDVVHEAMIRVDEAGTEAAAATAVIAVDVAAMLPPNVQFTADRPFLFVIRDNPTGSILFFGQVVDPSVSSD